MDKHKQLTAFDLVFYTVVATIGIRWLPVAAASGPSALPLWLLAFLTFSLPLSVATVELTARYPGSGSLYSWTRGTFGPLAGFVCGWFYWVSLFPYFAGIIYFTSGLMLSALGLDTHNAALYLATSIAIAAVATGTQLLGLRFSKWLANIGALGTWLIFFLLVFAAGVLVWRGGGATNFATASYLPKANFDSAILWGTIVFGLCGAETVAFLRDTVEGGMRTIRRALLLLGITMVAIYILGTAAMLVILPAAEMTRLSGLTDALNAAFAHVGYPALAIVAITGFAFSQFGGLAAWFGIGTQLPVEAGIDSFLPPIFARRHPKTGAPVAAILLQGGLTVVMVVLSQAGEGAAAAYDFLVAMSVLTATIPYIYVFAVYLSHRRWPEASGVWQPPGGRRTSRLLGVIGMAATLTAIACTLVPSGSDAHPAITFFKIVGSTAAMLAVGLLLYRLGTRRRTHSAGA